MKIETVLCASIICVCVYVCTHIYRIYKNITLAFNSTTWHRIRTNLWKQKFKKYYVTYNISIFTILIISNVLYCYILIISILFEK